MKKFLAIITCLIVAIGVMGMTACGDSTFKGDYKEVDKETASEFAAGVENYRGALDFENGMEFEFTMEGGSGASAFNIGINCKSVYKNQQPSEMEGDFKTTISGTTVKGDVYYSNGFIYMNQSGRKIKMAYDYDAYLSEMVGSGSAALITIQDVIAYVGAENSVGSIKVYLDRGETVSKFKVEFNEFVLGGVKTDGEYYFVYDADGKLAAYKTDVKMTVSGTEASLYAVAKAYDGEISLPSDLDTYIQVS